MGLLDTISSKFSSMYDTENPNYEKAQALLGLSQGLLSASGPSRMPVSMGQALGAGLQGMGQGFQQARSTLLAKQKENRMKEQADMINRVYGMFLPTDQQPGDVPGTGTVLKPGTPPIAPSMGGMNPGVSFGLTPSGPTLSYDPYKAYQARRQAEVDKDKGVGSTDISPEQKREAALLDEKRRREAEAKLPDVELQAEKTTSQIDNLLKHSGLDSAFGYKTYLPARYGSDRADFEAKLEQLQSTVFVENRDKLKGGGSITDYEGNKAAQAEIAMSQAQSPEQFREGLKEYKYWVNRGLQKLREKAGKQQDKPSAGSGWGVERVN